MTDSSNDNSGFGLEPIDTAHNQRVVSSCVIDLRTNVRVDTRFPACMISQAARVDGFVINLSRSGLRFEGGCELLDLQIKGNGEPADHPPEVVEICFELPAGLIVIVQAVPVYVIDGDSSNYHCGMEFRTFVEGEQALVEYLHARCRTL